MPQTFGKYTLVERIAAGGMAEVYRGKIYGVAGFEKTVAIKRILPHFVNDDGFVQMFVREANVAVKLSHANVVQVYELGRVGDDYYIALEFVEGRDLKTIVKKGVERRSLLPVDVSAFVVQKMCAGLHHAHTATDDFGAPLGIVHRDVSPHNVLVSWSGEVKVADFGIAKLTSAVRHTRTGTLKGKLAYMSPEQSNGDPDLDARSDVFAAGIVLYELLTGSKPFDGETDRELLKKIREAPTPLPSERVKGIPRALDAIVETAMAKKREERYQDAAQMGRALATWLQRTGTRLVDDEAVAAVLRELCGPRPVTPTPVSRGGGTPVLPPGALDAPAGALAVESAPTAVRPLTGDDAGPVEVFAAATPVAGDRRDASTSQATFAGGLTGTLPSAKGGALLLAAGAIGGVALFAGGIFLSRGGLIASAPTPTPTPLAVIATPQPEMSPSAAITTGTLRVAGSPPGALVKVDGKLTARLGEPLAGLAFGKHTAVVSAEDYRAKSIGFEISAAAPEATPQVVLARGQGELRIAHGEDNDFRVEIAGVVKPGQELERSFPSVPAGRYVAKITRGGQQWTKAVVVRDGHVTKMKIQNVAGLAATTEFVPDS